jgi:DNA-directed RNA polymerase sigma subunit (sigma70/sigma32)
MSEKGTLHKKTYAKAGISFMGFTVDEVSSALSLPNTRVRKIESLALTKLKKQFELRGIKLIDLI